MDILRFGLFLGSFSGGFKSLLYFIRQFRTRDDGLTPIVAGGVAGMDSIVTSFPQVWMISTACADIVRSESYICDSK
jgi:hypothetical protein